MNLWAGLGASICGLAGTIAIASPALPDTSLLQVIALAIALLAGVFIMGLSFIHYRRHPWIPGQSTTLMLIRSVRELETTGNYRALCRLLDRRANDFFGEFRRPPGTGRDAPRRYRARWEAEAAVGAHAIASQAERLLKDPLDTSALADDLRRMIIRIVTGYWQQVKDLDASQGADLWTPPGIGRRIAAVQRNEVTWKGPSRFPRPNHLGPEHHRQRQRLVGGTSEAVRLTHGAWTDRRRPVRLHRPRPPDPYRRNVGEIPTRRRKSVRRPADRTCTGPPDALPRATTSIPVSRLPLAM